MINLKYKNMNQKIPTSIGTAILIIIALTVSAFVWRAYEMNPISYEQSVIIKLPKEKQVAVEDTAVEQINNNSKCEESWNSLSVDEQIQCMKKETSTFSYFPEIITVSGEYIKGVTERQWYFGPRLEDVYFKVDDVNTIPHNLNSIGEISFKRSRKSL